jgi:hypothetical protein
MKFIIVKGVAGTTSVESSGEDDGEGDIVTQEVVLQTAINVAEIRSFNVRKPMADGTPRVGTRIVFANKTALPVQDLFEDVVEMVRQASAS